MKGKFFALHTFILFIPFALSALPHRGEFGYTLGAMDFLHHPDKLDSSPAAAGIEYIEIDTSRRKRWMGQLFFVLCFAIAAVVLVALFNRFTGSIRYALALVAFMLTYMLIMGYLAGKNT